MPPIDEIVGLLNETSPRVLEHFRSEHPEFRALLQKGIIAGARKDRNSEELSLRFRVAESVLEGAIARCQNESSRMRQRLKTADRLQLVSQCLTFAAGASILSTISKIWSASEPAIKLFYGIKSLVSGL